MPVLLEVIVELRVIKSAARLETDLALPQGLANAAPKDKGLRESEASVLVVVHSLNSPLRSLLSVAVRSLPSPPSPSS